MPLSANTRRALQAYDSFTDFARCPDLPWVPEVYEPLDDEIAQTMLRSFCYAWAAGQQAAGVYCGAVADLADALFDQLPSWDERLSPECKLEWTLKLGVTAVLMQNEPRPLALVPPAECVEMSASDHEALDDMAAFFHIPCNQAALLFQIGRALEQAVLTPAKEVGG
jgi:hypothetical protein